MTPREIIRRTLDFDNPSRVAHSFEPSDFLAVNHTAQTLATDWEKLADSLWQRIDEWGNLWRRIDPTSKGEVVGGVLDDLSRLNAHEFPDFSKPADYETVKKVRSDNPDIWLIGWVPGFAFNVARKLRKLDQYLMDLVLEPDRIAHLHDRIDEAVEQMIRNYAQAGVDSIMFPEDWGTQQQLLINPKLWYSEFMPRFEKLCGIAHQCGIRVFMHSCGQNESIVPGLVEAGIDALQFDQPELHGLDTLAGHQEKNNITFWCPVDIQTVLQSKDETLIREKAREMLDKLWKGRGGFIAGFYEDNASIGLDAKWQGYATDEFLYRGVDHH